MNRRIFLHGALLSGAASAADWPQWRGPNRDGVAPGAASAWPEKLKTAWKQSVGEGHSSPVVAGKYVYVLSRQANREVVTAFELDSGKKTWQDAYDAPYDMNPAATSHGKGPKSTPLAAGGRLFTLGISGILSSYALDSGKLAWRKEFSKQYRTTSPLYGTAMSPVLEQGLLVAHVGGHNSGALTAFDPASGAVKWSWDGDAPGYASPVPATFDGVRQLITETQNHVVGVESATGKLLWKVPFKTDYDQNSVTPLVAGANILYSGVGQPLTAIRPARQGGAWTAAKVWESASTPLYMSSPVLSGGLLFGYTHRNKGQLVCLDPASGKLHWSGPARQGDNASLLAQGDLLVALTTESELIVFRRDAGAFQQVRRYTVADTPVWAHPAIAAGNRVLVKDRDSLALWTA